MIDHLVYATRDLAATVRSLETLLGVAATPGGRHPVWGTRNALIALGPRTYLEIVGPDPEAVGFRGSRPFGIDTLERPGLATWACAATGLPEVVAAAALHRVDLGEVRAGSRRRPDGTLLRWSMTDLFRPRMGGVMPFFIDWGDTPHPAQGLPGGLRLESLRVEHPEARRVASVLEALGLGVPVTMGERPALIALIAGPVGSVELRG